MPIMFTCDDKSINIDDVPLDEYIAIEEETGVGWTRLTQNPWVHAKASKALAERCARILEVELPDLTPNTFVKLWEIVEDADRPSEYNEGIPDPKVEDSEPETT